MEYTQHPLSAAFPGMSDEEFAGLCDDMRLRGQRDEITIYDGQVLDGWHRYRACQVIAMPPRLRDFPEGADPLAFVKSYNLHRRHLSASQRAIAVVACREWANSGINQRNARTGAAASPVQTVPEMAREAEVSERTIQHAKRAVEAGIGDQVRDGKLSAERAAEIVKPPVSPKPKAPPEPRTIELKPGPPRSTTIEVDRDDYEEMKQELDRYHADSVALESVLDADDALAAAVNEIRQLNAQLAALQTRFNGLQNEKNAAIKQVKSLQRQLDAHVIRTRGGLPI